MNENMKDNHKKIILPVCIIVFSILILHAFASLRISYLNSELDRKQEELKQTAQIKVESVQKKYVAMRKSLEALANGIKEFTIEDEDIIRSELELLSQVGHFSYVGVSDAQGNSLDSQGMTINIKDRDYFKKAMNGEKVISDVLESNMIPDDQIQVLAFPIMKENEPRGIVFGILNVGEINILLENETSNHIYTQIVDSKGNYIIRGEAEEELTQNKNIWDEFKKYKFIDSSADVIKHNMDKQGNGNFTFQYKNEERVSFYRPVNIGNYYIFTTTNSAYIKNRATEISENIFLMVFEMAVAAFVLFFGIYRNNKFMHEKLKKSHKEVLSSVKMIEIAIEESNQYIFEYDIRTKILKRKAGVKNTLFSKEFIENVPESIIESGIIADSSIENFKDMFARIKDESSIEKMIKVQKENNSYWFEVKIKSIYDENNKIINTVGVVDDITDIKLQEELLEVGNKEKLELKKRAERDGLTGLYNVAALNTKVSEVLNHRNQNPGPHLFVLIDLDNFKEINDNFGHQYGDKVLTEVAQILQNMFRRDDIVARLGGDEFVVFLVNAASYEVMKPLFQQLCDKLSRTYTQNDISVKISASLGISVAPEQGTTFKELYKKSDMALYQVKKQSKNGFKNYVE